LGLAVEEAINDDLVIARGQHSPQLPTAPVALFGEVARRGECRLLATGHPAHVHIQDLPVLPIVMPIAVAVLAIDRVERCLHLADGRLGAGIQRVLHHRLLGAPRPTERGL
jgi:hypothetical protein